jgi:hypothetical protein
MTERDPELERYRASVAIRNFEIELLWKRALYFWGLIAASFIAYANLRKEDDLRGLAIACFGMVCAVIWTLANRGSKYWQEEWEDKVERTEEPITGPLFSVQSPPQDKGLWKGKRFSASQLAIALSDFTAMLWFSFVVADTYELIRKYLKVQCTTGWVILLIPGFCIAYIVLVAVKTGSHRRKPKRTDAESQLQR